MNFKCFLLGLVIFVELSMVVWAGPSFPERSDDDEENFSVEPTIEDEGFSEIIMTTLPDEEIEYTTTDLIPTEKTSITEEPEEFITVTSIIEENSTQHEYFPKKKYISSEETTLNDLEQSYSTNEISSETLEEDLLPESKPLTTLIDLEEDFNMSFDKIASAFMEENEESKVEKKRRKGRKEDADFVEIKDDLLETEFIKQEVKHNSLGIEPLALVALPERQPRPTFFSHPRNLTHQAAFYKKSTENTVYTIPPLTVDLDNDANLLLNPNERQELAFQVTNNLNNAARASFTVRDELGILLEIDRYVAIIGPHASTTVKVAVLPKSGQTSDRITFIATASEQVRKEVIVDVESNYRYDTDNPFVDYNYLSDCTDIVLSKCKEGTWTIKISAKDTESGLKVLTTTPKGLYFAEGYVSGTKEVVSGIYSESCCNADLEIVAIDRMNNRYVRQINAYRAPLSFWAVIAISSMALILLTIFIATSMMCLKKCKKDEASSFDLPTYRGGARTRY